MPRACLEYRKNIYVEILPAIIPFFSIYCPHFLIPLRGSLYGRQVNIPYEPEKAPCALPFALVKCPGVWYYNKGISNHLSGRLRLRRSLKRRRLSFLSPPKIVSGGTRFPMWYKPHSTRRTLLLRQGYSPCNDFSLVGDKAVVSLALDDKDGLRVYWHSAPRRRSYPFQRSSAPFTYAHFFRSPLLYLPGIEPGRSYNSEFYRSKPGANPSEKYARV